MIKQLALNAPARIKSINKEELVKKVKGMLHRYHVMFIYFSGSIAYNTFDPYTSDIDINVFVDGYKGYIHTDLDEYDLFIFGKDCLEKRQNMDESLQEYEKLFIDDVCSLDNTLIYLNKAYQNEYNTFKKSKVENVMKKYLKNVYDYFMFHYVDSEHPYKRFYHVIRIRGQLENYKKTGVFDLTMDEKYIGLMKEFKENYDNDRGKEIYRNEIGKYLEEIKEYEEDLE